MKQVPETVNWWSSISESSFCDMGYPGMKIFCKTDQKEFVDRVIKNWKIHEANKAILDKRTEEIENSDERFKQYSATRDEPLLNDYKKFVQQCSLKDVLHMYSADYEEKSVQDGAKAGTAKNYGNRLLEFFRFMATTHDDFHFDWFIDYSGQIEKNYQNKETTV